MRTRPSPPALSINLVAADVSPRILSLRRISADSRRRLQFKGTNRESSILWNLSPFGGEREKKMTSHNIFPSPRPNGEKVARSDG
jgi:hypothetical protein